MTAVGAGPPAGRLLFLTGRLARPRLDRILAGMGEASATWAVHDIGVKVAALMTEAIIERRLPRPVTGDCVVLPGRVRADLERLSRTFGVPFVRGPDELKDLPGFLGRGGREPDLSRHDLRIFAEIVDASALSLEGIADRAGVLANAGADVIDLGCLPDTPFPHLEEAVQELRKGGFAVSVDSADVDELRRGARAGAQYLLSLTRETLDIAADTGVTPVLIPAVHGDLDSLEQAIELADKRGISCIADPILDPIHFGFMESLERYGALRRRMPEVEMMMGTGNLTELTDADSSGLTVALLGICSELRIRNVLTVQVSPHARRTVQEHDYARRLMFAARRDESLPRDYGAGLLQIHDRAPYASSAEEIGQLARQVHDHNFRIDVAEDGIHVYSSKGHHIASDAMSLFPLLGVASDGAHAFYLGTELAKAELAYTLGKRYTQDEPLNWGVASDHTAEDMTRLAVAGHTLRARTRDA